MAIIANKRSMMTLYSGATDILSHRVRIVLAEKGVAADVISADTTDKTGRFTRIKSLWHYAYFGR